MDALKNIKIVFCDIDGTLVDDDKKISQITKETIKKLTKKGIYVVLVSGRDYIHTVKKSIDANASNIIISSNGALIYDYSKEIAIYADRINSEKVKTMSDYCNNNKVGLLIRSLSGRYYNDYLIAVDESIDKYKKLHDNTDFNSIYASQLLLVSKDKNNILNAQSLAKNIGLEVTNYSESFIKRRLLDTYSVDINNKNVSKGAAITYLLEYLNIEKENSMCFGDFINDIDMFKSCKIKVAMKNACDELKNQADFITEYDNNNNGVANFLNKYLL